MVRNLDDNKNVVRDLEGKDADELLVEKLLTSLNLELRYDNRYLTEMDKIFTNQIIPITNQRLRTSFEHYTH